MTYCVGCDAGGGEGAKIHFFLFIQFYEYVLNRFPICAIETPKFDFLTRSLLLLDNYRLLRPEKRCECFNKTVLGFFLYLISPQKYLFDNEHNICKVIKNSNIPKCF